MYEGLSVTSCLDLSGALCLGVKNNALVTSIPSAGLRLCVCVCVNANLQVFICVRILATGRELLGAYV